LRSKSPNLWQFLVGSLSFCFQQLDFGVFLQFLDITPGYHHLMELLNIKFEQGGTPIDIHDCLHLAFSTSQIKLNTEGVGEIISFYGGFLK